MSNNDITSSNSFCLVVSAVLSVNDNTNNITKDCTFVSERCLKKELVDLYQKLREMYWVSS